MWDSILATFVLGLGLLAAASPVLAADPPTSMAGMPDPATITDKFAGSDALDTAAKQVAVFSRLETLAGMLVSADRLPTPEETQFQHLYNDAWTALIGQVKSSLPPDQQGYFLGTQFAAWYVQIDHYRADPILNQQFRDLFSADFKQTHAALFTELEEGGQFPSLPAPTVTAPPVTEQITAGLEQLPTTLDRLLPQLLPYLAYLAVYGVLFKVVGPN